MSPSKGYFVLLIFYSILDVLCWNCYNIVMYWSDWRVVFNLDFNLNILKKRRGLKTLVCRLILSQIGGFLSKGHAMEPQFSVSGEYLLINSCFVYLSDVSECKVLFLLVATNSFEWYNTVKYTEASALFCVRSHEVTCTLHSVTFFWCLFAEGRGS